MKKTVILSTNDNSDYLSYLEYTQKAWNILGWNTLTFYLGQNDINNNEQNQIIPINAIEGYKDCTVVQVSRFFGYQYITDGIIMTSDVDMIPLSDYWHPEYDNITCYGYDLTNYTQFPICYIAANHSNWKSLVSHDNIESLLRSYSCAKSNNFYEHWFTDQLIITEKIMNFHVKPRIVNRGFSKYNLPIGRIDRSLWDLTKSDDSKKIDAHMPRPFNIDLCQDLLNKLSGIYQ